MGRKRNKWTSSIYLHTRIKKQKYTQAHDDWVRDVAWSQNIG